MALDGPRKAPEGWLEGDAGGKMVGKRALVVHSRLSAYAGAEYLSFYVCRILQDAGYHVSFLSDVFDPSRAEEIYSMGEALSNCTHIRVPLPRSNLPPKVEGLSRLPYVFKIAKFAESLSQRDFQLVFSTQSSIFYFPGKKLYHFVYELTDLFRYPMPLVRATPSPTRPMKRIYLALLRSVYRALARPPRPTWFFVAGEATLQKLRVMGYQNSSFFYPPARVFRPRLPKKKRIFQASRIAPQKRLEVLFELARKLPRYDFLVVGKNPPGQRQFNPGYSEKLLSQLPPNVTYVETPIIHSPELLEESKVYLHTSLEEGVPLTLIEAMSAGCIPVAPKDSAGGEVLRAARIGYTYGSVEEAVEKLELAMDTPSPWTPSEISQRAKEFGPSAFEDMIRRLILETSTQP